jgi:hypothetical protein
MQTDLVLAKSYQVFQEVSMAEENTHGGKRVGAGRPQGALNKLTRPVKELAASQGPASIEKLVHLRDSAQSEQVQFAAAKELLDRAYGRTRQDIDVNGDKRVIIVIDTLSERSPCVIPARALPGSCDDEGTAA